MADSTSFRVAFEKVTEGDSGTSVRGSSHSRLSEASAAMHAIDPAIYADNDSWADANKGKADITPEAARDAGLRTHRRSASRATL